MLLQQCPPRPEIKGDISDLIITLYNGAGVGTMTCGEELKTSCIIASNFTTKDQQSKNLMHSVAVYIVGKSICCFCGGDS